MDRGITITAVWRDVYMIELLIEARSEHFSGAVREYTGRPELQSAIISLAGFPQGRNDRRAIELGGARLNFYTVSAAVHPQVEVHLKANELQPSPLESATIIIPVEAAGIDSFLCQLQHLAETEEGTAYLPIANQYVSGK